MSTDIAEFLGELGAGVFEEKLTRTLSETAIAAMQYNKVGEITLKFKITPINQSQVKIVHTIVNKAPTMNGEKAEKNSTDTHMYVGEKGKMSLFPENQTQMFTKTGTTATNKG